MLHSNISVPIPKENRLREQGRIRFILQSVDGLYFQARPAFPVLTRHRVLAREFADEVLADAFRETIELRSGRSFTTFAVLGRF